MRSGTPTSSTSHSSSTANACSPPTHASSSSTSPAIIAAISEFVALSPGDVVLTGTPAGVGYRREPKVLLREGDRDVIEIERVGRLENPVVSESPGD
jgi:hypothetical protein